MTVLPRRSKLNGYVAAISATALVSLARLGLADWLIDSVPFLPFVGAVVAVAAWVGGLGPGVAATLLGSLIGTSFFLHPAGQAPNLFGDVVHVATFVGIGGVVSLLSEALHRSQNREALGHRRLASTLDGMGDAFFQLDADWRLVTVNRQYEADWGRTSADLLGKVFWDAWPEAVGTQLETEFRRAAGGGGGTEFETQYGPTGRWYRVRVQPSPDGGLSVFSQDVTQRVRQQAELTASHERFAQLADAVPQIVTVRRANGDLDFVNRRWGEYTGRPDAEADDFVGVVHPDDRAGLNARWGIAKLARVALEAEFRLRRSDGAYRWFGTSTDVHDQREAADRLRDADRRIRESDWGRTTHIVALTGWGQEQDRRKSADAGADGHLVKPVAPETVFDLLAGLADVR